ncbi:uncharacterized protein LOC119101966 [Pollicipes pollicipes]|uniref:uncharacterized protein LOC119101966 n=1 Tax=Pollicipes pollicipes TaxID=41117 RepID=UPI001885406A|nr:uncharacterized protein LOC119101966 [Pollicipes pollicipes]
MPKDQGDEELTVELRLASSLLHQVRAVSGVPDCDGMYLQSQPSMPDLVGLTRRHALLELFRVSLYEAAHLNLMAQDIIDSSYTCGNETFDLMHQIFTLAGNLQNILCVISENISPTSLQPLLETVSEVTLHRYKDCPRRLMRNCLVLENTGSMLALYTQYLHEAELAENGFPHLRAARAVTRRSHRLAVRRERHGNRSIHTSRVHRALLRPQ